MRAVVRRGVLTESHGVRAEGLRVGRVPSTSGPGSGWLAPGRSITARALWTCCWVPLERCLGEDSDPGSTTVGLVSPRTEAMKAPRPLRCPPLWRMLARTFPRNQQK